MGAWCWSAAGQQPASKSAAVKERVHLVCCRTAAVNMCVSLVAAVGQREVESVCVIITECGTSVISQ